MDAIIVFIITFFFTQIFIQKIKKRHPYINTGLINILYFYHVFFAGVYYTYALFRPSDSKQYYYLALTQSDFWKEYYHTGTDFVTFFAIPFVKLGLRYEGTMLLFAWFGFLGFIYAYLLFRENIQEKVRLYGMDLLTLLLFLPNMHFWTASLGKGSIIFLGLMMMSYAVSKPKKRLLTLIIGAFFVYMIRPHVMLFVMSGITIGYLTGKEKIKPITKIWISLLMIFFLLMASDTILKMVNLENSTNLTGDFLKYSELQSERLAEKAGSGVNMNNYSLPFKFFTFWFRPLFVDAPNFIGLIVSFENLLYLLIFFKTFNLTFFRFLRKGPRMVKMAAVTFFLTTFALTFLMSNLGIIMRQKSMVMYFAFFVIYYFLAIKQQYLRDKYFKNQQKNIIRKTGSAL
jgi:hypothetical protein